MENDDEMLKEGKRYPFVATPTRLAYSAEFKDLVRLKSGVSSIGYGWECLYQMPPRGLTKNTVRRALYSLYESAEKFAYDSPENSERCHESVILGWCDGETEVVFEGTSGKAFRVHSYRCFMFYSTADNAIITVPEAIFYYLQRSEAQISEAFEKAIMSGKPLSEAHLIRQGLPDAKEFLHFKSLEHSHDNTISNGELALLASELAIDDFETGDVTEEGTHEFVSPMWVNFSKDFEDGEYVLQTFKLPRQGDEYLTETLIARQSMHHLALAHMRWGFTLLADASEKDTQISSALRRFLLEDEYKAQYCQIVNEEEGTRNFPQVLKDRANTYFPLHKR